MGPNEVLGTNWHSLGSGMAQVIAQCAAQQPVATSSVAVSALASSFCRMLGLSSAIVGIFSATHLTPDGLTGFGALLVQRSEGATTKNYVYGLASSSGTVMFNGPFKRFDGHWRTEGQTADPMALMLRTPMAPS